MAADVDKPIERSLSVSASGSIQAVPDIATISAGVLTEADTARDALNRNNAVMAKLIDGLKAASIAPKDIQTSQLNVSPRYTQSKEGRPATVSGYTVSNQVRVTVRDVKRLDVSTRLKQPGSKRIRIVPPRPASDDPGRRHPS